MSFFDKIFGKKKIEDEDLFGFNEDEDTVFVNRFKSAGGMFFYCDSKQEGIEGLYNILKTEDINDVLCVDEELGAFLNVLDCNHSKYINPNQDIAFIKCEYLIVLDGSVMVTSDQMKHLKKTDLPKKVIIWAHPNQIISSTSDAMVKIRYNKQNNLPSNITNIYGNQVNGFADIATAKQLFLLLVEEENITQ